MSLAHTYQDRNAQRAVRIDWVSRHDVLFGCHMGVLNFIVGGKRGYSCVSKRNVHAEK